MFRMYVGALALLLCRSSIPSHAQEQVSLGWKFVVTKTFYQEARTHLKLTTTIENKVVAESKLETLVISWTPVGQNAKGCWLLDGAIESMRVESDLGGRKVSFDSKTDSNPEGDVEKVFKGMVGAQFRVTLGPNMEILGIDGATNFEKNVLQLKQILPGQDKLFSGKLFLEQLTTSLLPPMPTVKVGKGYEWKREIQMEMGPLGKCKSVNRYIYDGNEGKYSRVRLELIQDYRVPDELVMGETRMHIKQCTLKTLRGVGTVLVDRDKHRVESLEMEGEAKGKLTVDIENAALLEAGIPAIGPVSVDCTQGYKASVRTMDNNPRK